MKFLDEYIEFFYSEMAPEEHKVSVSDSIINKYKKKLPKTLLKYWKEYGWNGYGHGIFWTVNPDDYQEVVDEWLKDTPFESYDKYYLIALSAFGKMFLWGEKTGSSLTITASYGMIFPRDKSDFIKAENGDMELLLKLFFSGMDNNKLDMKDVNEKKMFNKAKHLYGPLLPGEMYGFSPAIPMGGEPRLENLSKVNAFVHLMFLANLGEKMVMQDIVKKIKEDKNNGLI